MVDILHGTGRVNSETASQSPERLPTQVLVPAAIAGGIGVLSGYALTLFILKFRVGDTIDQRTLYWTLAVSLILAGVVGFLFESVRHGVEHGEGWRSDLLIKRLLATMVTVLMFEVFSKAFGDIPDLLRDPLLVEAADELLGPMAGQTGSYIGLAAIAGLWVIIGASMAVFFARIVWASHALTGWRGRLKTGLRLSLWSILLAAGMTAGYVVAIRLVLFLAYVLQHPEASLNITEVVVGSNPFLLILRSKVELLFEAGDPGAIFAAFIGLAFWIWLLVKLWRSEPLISGVLVGLPLVIMILGPILASLPGLLLTTAVFWAVPAITFGCLAPFLSHASAEPRYWSFISFGSGSIIVLLGMLAQAWSAVPLAAILIVIGAVVRRSRSQQQPWPLAAALAVILVLGLTSVRTVNWSSERIYREANLAGISQQGPDFSAFPEQMRPDAQEPEADEPYVPGTVNIEDYIIKEEQAAPQRPEPVEPARFSGALFDLVVTGAFGFWSALAVLAAWAITLRLKGSAPELPSSEKGHSSSLAP